MEGASAPELPRRPVLINNPLWGQILGYAVRAAADHRLARRWTGPSCRRRLGRGSFKMGRILRCHTIRMGLWDSWL